MTHVARWIIVGLLLVTTSASAQQRVRATEPETWKKHAFADDRFEVEFSGPVKSEPLQLDAQTRRRVVRSVQHMQEAADLIFVVGAQHNIDAVHLEAGARASFNAFRCKNTQTEIEVPIDGGRGVELKGSACFDGSMRAEARYFQVGKWFYQVIALFHKDTVEEAIARRFLLSFKALPR